LKDRTYVGKVLRWRSAVQCSNSSHPGPIQPQRNISSCSISKSQMWIGYQNVPRRRKHEISSYDHPASFYGTDRWPALRFSAPLSSNASCGEPRTFSQHPNLTGTSNEPQDVTFRYSPNRLTPILPRVVALCFCIALAIRGSHKRVPLSADADRSDCALSWCASNVMTQRDLLTSMSEAGTVAARTRQVSRPSRGCRQPSGRHEARGDAGTQAKNVYRA
jgi:hypothetical protein